MDVLGLDVTPSWCHSFYYIDKICSRTHVATFGAGVKWVAGTRISTWRKNTKVVLWVDSVEDPCSFAMSRRRVVTRRVFKAFKFTVCHVCVLCWYRERQRKEREYYVFFFAG